MKTILTFLVVFLVAGAAWADETNDVYIAMKRMEAATQSSLSLNDFRKEMINLQLSINLFKESETSKANPRFTNDIDKAFLYYKLSEEFWKDYATNGYKNFPAEIMRVDKYQAREFIALFPDENRSVEDGGFYFREKGQNGPYRYIDNRGSTSYLWREATKILADAKISLEANNKPTSPKKKAKSKNM
ncbi:hypothetical protein [Solidesulfovibrio sp.]